MSEDVSVFISYSRDDLAFADQIEVGLRLVGFGTTLDRHAITGGEDWRKRLGLLIQDAETIVFVVSPSSLQSEVCAWELGEAIRLGKRIIPAVCRPTTSSELPEQLRSLDFISFFDDPRRPGSGFGTGLSRLVQALKTDLGWLVDHTRLLRRATEWDVGGRSNIRLLSGDDVAEAKAWVARRPKNAEPTALHLEFIHASERAEAARRDDAQRSIKAMQVAQDDRAVALARAEVAAKRLAARSWMFIGVAAVLATIAVGFGFHSHRSATHAETQTKAANEAKQTAELRGTEALAAAGRAEAAYDVAVDSADRFLTDLAGKFKDTAAIPDADLRQLLSRGEAFLTEMAGRMGAAPKLAWVESRLLARFAELSLDIDIDDAAMRLQRSEERLITARIGMPDSLLVAHHQASLHIQKSRIAFEKRDYAKQLSEATSANAALSQVGSDSLDNRLIRSEALFALARAHWKSKQYEAGANVATDCLDMLKTDSGDDVDWIRVQCLHMRALLLGPEALKKTNESQADLTEEIKLLRALISKHPSNITYRRTLANALNNFSSHANEQQQWQTNIDQLQLAVSEGDEALKIAPWSASMRSAQSHYLRWQAKAHQELGQSTTAVLLGTRSLDYRRELARADKANTSRQSDYEDSLDDVANYFSSVAFKDLTPDLSAQKLRLLIERRDHYLSKYGHISANSDHFFTVFEAKFRVAETQAWIGEADAALKTAMELAAIADAGVDRGDPNPRYRYWSHWTRSSFGSCQRFLESSTIDVEARLQGCQRTAQWVEAYMVREPRDWMMARGGYANTLMAIAELQMLRGRQRLAIGAMEEAAFRGNRAAAEKLEAWYRTGDGPTGVDPVKAKQYARALTSRNWGMKRFNVPVRWWGASERRPAQFFIVDPVDANHDPVEDEIFRLEQIQGLAISDDIKDSFRKLLKIAIENNVSFQDLTVYALGDASQPSDVLLNVLLQTAGGLQDRSTKADKQNRALQRARQEWAAKDGQAALAKAFEEMVKRSVEARLKLTEYTDDFQKYGPPELAVQALTALINGPTSTLLDRTLLVARRGNLHSYIGNMRQAEDDLLVAIAVRPNAPQLLNTLAYAWLEHNQSLDVAVEFLERAVKAAPDNLHIADSLGWAYVKTGRAEDGVKILRSVVAGLPDEADGYAHLADGLRRLGDRAEARRVLAQATERVTGDGPYVERLRAFIADQQRLLSD